MTNKEIIKALDELDLSSYPYDEVKRLVSLFQPKVLRLTITAGAIIERIRPDVNVYERKDVSYRPADKNEKPQTLLLGLNEMPLKSPCFEDFYLHIYTE